VEPLNKSVRFAISAMTVSPAQASIEIKRLDDLSYQVTGNIPMKSGAFRRRFALSDPALYAAGTFRTMLEQKGITVKGEIKRGRMPAEAEIVATVPGPDMKQMLRDMNVSSLNVVAENLLLLLGAKRFGAPGTREKGIAAVKEYLQSLDLPLNEVTIADGSGLSAENRVTAQFLARYLRTVTKKSWFPVFRDSLARPGYDGTVKDMQFKDSRFRVKTGMLKDSLALAGYGVDAGGKEIAFAYMVNGPGTGYLPLDAVGGEVLRYLANEVLQ
jgi:D-alanyl-D-alanine carboxypeptidase/D-alanyl-D-alanine-endopeptidase (penicillin-binding protein 4)